MSSKSAADALGVGLAIEYTRDSPLFRQQLLAFEDAFSQFAPYCNGVIDALSEMDRALSTLQQAQSKLQAAINPSSSGSSRCLFTNAFPQLGDLSDTLRMLALTLSDISGAHNSLRQGITREIIPLFQSLAAEADLTAERQLRRDVEAGFYAYESLLASALQSRTKLSDAQAAEITDTRADYELKRFDLVARLNFQDARKKLELTKSCCAILRCLKESNSLASSALNDAEAYLKERADALVGTEEQMSRNVELWSGVRARLQGELMGALPPPGAPPGALSPVQPRSHLGYYSYTAALTTEVLSAGTRTAAYEDVRHARDDGVFKQGYLFVSGIFKRFRRWHRLYATKLYQVELSSSSPTCDVEIVCDVRGASISAKPGAVPHKFIIATKDGKRIELQAENEDEMVKWIYSLRRCSSGLTGRASESASGRNPADADEVEVTKGPAATMLKEFVRLNASCAECSAEPVRWISTSLGVTLCEECAAVHRQLTWAVSKLKSIRLDEFSDWQMELLMSELGNAAAKEIWEKCIPEGWTKPEPSSSAEDKAQWILAKYRWYGFVDEFRVRSDEQLQAGIMEAAALGSVSGVLWWLSHKADINCVHPDGSGRTPLHEAIENEHVHLVALLLQNGADMYAVDARGYSPLDISAMPGKHKKIAVMMAQIQRGDY